MTEHIPTNIAPPRSAVHVGNFKSWKRWFIPSALIALIADQASKTYLFSLPADTNFPSWIERTCNLGVAWGIGGSWPGVVALSSVVLIPLLGWFYWRHFRGEGRWENLAFGCILGGAVGNAWDRLMTHIGGAKAGYTGVRDFIRIDLKIVGIDYVWPNFNLADSAISIGFLILLAVSLSKPARTGQTLSHG